MARLLGSWLEGVKEYAEETESARQFWLWGGISTIAGALQRKVWLKFGAHNLYPNLYILLVAPPAQRKDAAVSFSRQILDDLSIPVAADSSSKRSFTSSLEKTSATEQFYFKGKPMPQCAMSVVSGEFSDLFAVNLKEMVECLTSVYDSRDIWKYETQGKGSDKLYNVCVNVLAATTPGWIMDNLPQSAIGGGFTSRFVMIYADQVYKRVTIPWIRSIEDLYDPTQSKKMETLYKALRSDLMHIHSDLIGPFEWDPEAYKIFDSWYKRIDEKLVGISDERVHPFVGRMHTIALKVAMALRVGYSDKLIITPPEIKAAVGLLEEVINTASDAFGGHGRSKTGPDVQRVMGQVKILKSASFRELMKLNYRHLNKTELQGVLGTIESMGLIRTSYSGEFSDGRISWVGKVGTKDAEVKK
jgi:hypothetical protein